MARYGVLVFLATQLSHPVRSSRCVKYTIKTISLIRRSFPNTVCLIHKWNCNGYQLSWVSTTEYPWVGVLREPKKLSYYISDVRIEIRTDKNKVNILSRKCNTTYMIADLYKTSIRCDVLAYDLFRDWLRP